MSQVTIVSNRLPVSVKKTNGSLEFYPSVGGLATGLASYTQNKQNKWIGWPGIVNEELSDEDKDAIAKGLKEHNCYPVFLTQKQVDGFYNGYSNSVLWPAFHSLAVGFRDMETSWVMYRQVNQLFADTVMGLSMPESTIWIHDYQLLLVPEMLRKERPYDLIGFFLHIPFPPVRIFKKLPHAKALLKGIIGSDLVGFHTPTYVENFLNSSHELHIGTPAPEQIILKDRVVKVTDFPLGIDYDKFSSAGMLTSVQERIRKNRKKYGKRKKIILTVDRLDPTKGLVERLMAYEELLRNNKRLRKKVVMVMLAIPTRTDIKVYRQLKERVEQLVLKINATYGTRRWRPVHYMYKTVPFEELAALYRVADVAFIAPIKDGMNLVAKEYVASRPDKQGVLVLSETAGAAQELSEALLVNPKRPTTLVEGLSAALTMTPQELKERVTTMQKQLASNTVTHWKRKYMHTLQSSNIGLQQPVQRLAGKSLDKLVHDYAKAKYPTILLDYDGVLAPFAAKPHQAVPSAKLLAMLKQLAERTDGGILIISGRGRRDLDEWLGNRHMTLAAEHGSYLKSGTTKWRKVIDTPTNWKRLILPVLQKYADKTPGAIVEEKESSLVWHYREASAFYAQKYSTILTRTLKPLLKPLDLSLYRGNMIIEIKSPEANKGVATRHWIKKKHDFILAMGDDYTDEDMFAAMPTGAYSVKVGRGKTLARYRINSVDDAFSILDKLSQSPR